MSFFISAIAFIIIFSALILVHEFGHFWMARKAGVRVEEFGFGLPPRAWGKKKGDTLYSLNWIPFGGFVKMLGEDSTKKTTDPKSFSNKPLRSRIAIVLAGVFMNFVLAILLLTIGFTFGMQPLLVSSEDVLKAIDSGVVRVQSGLTVKSVMKGSAAEKAGFQPNDVIMQLDNKDIKDESFVSVLKKPTIEKHSFLVKRGNLSLYLYAGISKDGGLGLEMFQTFFLPRVVLQDVKKDSNAYKAGVRPDDVIIALNGKPLYVADDFQSQLLQSSEMTLTVERHHQLFDYHFTLPQAHTVMVGDVVKGSVAEKSGFKTGDILIQAGSKNIPDVDSFTQFNMLNKGKNVSFIVQREGKTMTLQAKPDANGKLGLSLSLLFSQQNNIFSMYTMDVVTSAVEIKNVSYPVHLAFVESLKEAKRLTGLTANMFVNVIRDVVGTFQVPDGVSGPIGIARMTHAFAQEGFMSLMRFMALLSLSLAVINVFPLPALDGGRLLFLVIEAVSGKPANQKVETVIHGVGFVVLIMLLFFITYNDISALFA